MNPEFSPELEIQLIAAVTAVACSLPGVFLVLRRMALVSDAISHAILPGIVVGFFIAGDLSSPLLLITAAATGVLTVALIEALNRSRLVSEDSAIGLVFPALFSLGVILISRYAGNVHLDVDSVLLGELAFAPFDRFVLGGHDLGPSSLWSMSLIALFNVVFIGVFFKEMKLATIDAGFAKVLGFRPVLNHYLLMAMVSVTAVGAFNAAGSILVVALMIAPPATAYLLVERFSKMLMVNTFVAVIGAIGGCQLGFLLDVSIAGSMAVVFGLIFALALLFAPQRGVLSQIRRRSSQKLDFSLRMLVVHLLNHEGGAEEIEECAMPGLHRHLKWPQTYLKLVVRTAHTRALVRSEGELLILTAAGRIEGEGAVVGEGA